MKVSRPPSPRQPGSTAKSPAVIGTRGKDFAAALKSAETPAVPRGATNGPATIRQTGLVADIGADLKAGKITPEAAVDKVVERILDRQLGASATAAVREQVGAALRESLADDPLLAAKVRALSRE
jgi:hypothetical protein